MTTDPLEITRNGKPIDLANLWAPHPAFLVCGGPSLNDYRLDRLRERGVVSLGVNQAAAWAPVKAWVFSDTQWKFHHALYLDPAVMTFAPVPKLGRHLHIKRDGQFQRTELTLSQCPNTYGFQRHTCFVPSTFFTTKHAHWGPGKHQPEGEPKDGCLCTMMIGLRLLHYLGVKRVYLLGVDFKGRNGRCYAFPEGKQERNRRYRWEGGMLERLKPELERHGIEVFNCNIDSACKLFPYQSFSKAVGDCKGSVPDDPLDTDGWYDMSAQQRQVKSLPTFQVTHYG